MDKQEMEEWIIEKRKLEIRYCGRCYTAKDVHPYGYCKTCWEKARDKKGNKKSRGRGFTR
tara:strand:+ start:311 stop:490 length:180 start_codon:yes stop_codon:yes gene_type:complete